MSLFYYFDMQRYMSLDYLKANQLALEFYYLNNRWLAIFGYVVIYILVTALSLPGAAILTLAGGGIFGFITCTVIVSFASTIGATLAFLVSRFLLRDYIQNKFKTKLETINRGMQKDGAFYLFSLRLIPAFPFFLINLLMGLTPIKTLTYFFVSQVGMLLGTMAYVNAGVQLSKVSALKEILSPTLILSFTLLGLIPIFAKKIVEYLAKSKVYKGFKRPKKFDYNMVVIGAGSAGLVTSYIGAMVKAKVALIEKNKMGGDCLNTGCVPSKALIKSANIIHYAKRCKEFGIKKMTIDFDFAKVMDRVSEVISKVEPHDSVERYSSLGVTCIKGEAKIISPFLVEVGGKVISTKNITVASGASPRILSIKGIEKIEYLTSDNIWQLRKLPKKLVVIGGGPIGLELAQAFSRLGSQVTVVHRGERILKKEDEDIAGLLTSRFESEGIQVKTSHTPKEFTAKTLICTHEGEDVKIAFDKVLIAVGRVANIGGMGLSSLGVDIRKNGTIESNDFLQTKYPNIFVCGDVTGPYQLTHMAAHQAWYCAVNGLMGRFKKFRVDYSVVPWCTYTDPEIATVGLTEVAARDKNIAYSVTKYSIDDLDRAIADGEDFGMVKVLTVPGSDKILGATIASSHASDLLLEFVTAMKYGLGLNKILGTIHSYPSMGEANKYAAGVWKMAHKPQKVLRFLEKYHNWERG